MTMTSNPVTINGVTLTGHHVPRQNSVLTPDALGFLAALHREFEPRRRELLAAREERIHALMTEHVSDHARVLELNQELRGIVDEREVLELEWLEAGEVLEP